MMPHEAQATMAKILFFVFATFVLCLGKTRAASFNDLDLQALKSPIKTSSSLLVSDL